MDDSENADGSLELTPRAPSQSDLVSLCRQLNDRGAKYIVVGGFAVIMAGYPRTTGDLDLLVADDLVNEAKVYDALATLPDKCVLELDPGDLRKYTVIRVADEILVDLMASASGIAYQDAIESVDWKEISGVRIPFASPELLWKMKVGTHRAKDQGDLYFLRQLFSSQGKNPP